LYENWDCHGEVWIFDDCDASHNKIDMHQGYKHALSCNKGLLINKIIANLCYFMYMFVYKSSSMHTICVVIVQYWFMLLLLLERKIYSFLPSAKDGQMWMCLAYLLLAVWL